MTSSQSNLAVALDGVNFHWDSDFESGGNTFHFRNMRFEVREKERIFLFGESGSGKSTLLGLIAGTLVPNNAGRIEILGTAFSGLSASGRDAFRAEHMGVIFQMFNLIPYLSAIENILLPLSFAPQRRQRAGDTKRKRLEKACELLEGLGLPADKFAGRKPSELSVGQQQRIAAARALVGDPELIIADEPTSSLDRNRQQEFVDLLFGLVERSGSTLILVSHDKTLADRFDRTVSMEQIAPNTAIGADG